jgi:fructose-1,6-bisphosphatase/inositol monophosphatase family enzyme
MTFSSTVFTSVSDLSAEQRRAAELLIGHRLDPAEIVVVTAARAKEEPTSEARTASLAKLRVIFDAIDEHGRNHGITSEEADAAIDEAIFAIRPRREASGI